MSGFARALLVVPLLLMASCIDDVPIVLPSCGDVHWAYSGPEGPDHWGSLCLGFAACGGVEQSPVNISVVKPDPTLAALEMSYDSSATKATHNGHTIQFDYDSGSSLRLDGAVYELVQFHFHTGSEHQVGSVTYPMEVHLVHRNPDNGALAVVGVLFETGAESPLLAQLEQDYPLLENDVRTNPRRFTVRDLLPSSPTYYRYGGSLTTPPCSEGVSWIVMKGRLKASTAQIAAMRERIHESNRPVQPLNGRVIRAYEGE